MESVKHKQSEFERLKVLILHLVHACNDGPVSVTVTKLNKLLYFIDFGHYAMNKQAITKFEYIKLPYGPVPPQLGTYLEILQSDRVIDKHPVINGSGSTVVYSPLMEPIDLHLYFSKEEIATIQKTIKGTLNLNASQGSDFSHFHFSWNAVEKYDTIPFTTSKHCAFPWLGRYGNDETKENFEETMRLRKISRENRDLVNSIKSLPGL